MENKNGKERFLVILTVFLCVIIIALLTFEVRLAVGWNPFDEVTGENLYYVSYMTGRDKNIHLLDEGEQEELAGILRQIRVRTTGLWIELNYTQEGSINPFLFDEIYGAGTKWSLVFEKTDQKGNIIEVRLLMLYEKKANSENPIRDRKDRYGLMINGERYFISEKNYRRLEQFVDSLLY